jgi:hypothetical protein
MRARDLILAATLCVSACSSEAERQRIETERQRVATEEKKHQDAEIEQKAKQLAVEMVAAEEKKHRDAETEQKAKQLAVEMVAAEKKHQGQIEQKAKQLAVEMAKEQRQMQAKEKAERKHQTLANIQRSPAPFFEASGLEFFDEGIVNRYQQLSKITVTNKSPFLVRDIRGQVDFLDHRNEAVASIPIRLGGPLPPNSTRTYSGTAIAGNRVQTDATESRFVVTTVVVSEDD